MREASVDYAQRAERDPPTPPHPVFRAREMTRRGPQFSPAKIFQNLYKNSLIFQLPKSMLQFVHG